MSSPLRRVLFVCYANACRSQMAEGFARHLAGDALEVQSAGLIAAGVVPETVTTMAELGISLEGQYSKRIGEVDLESFDLIVTLSDQAHGQLQRSGRDLPLLHRPVLDPVGVRGTPQEVARMFALTRDDVREVVLEVLRWAGLEA
jgi:arsenate reductase